ncbi:hypothetical protein CerSpe_139290 [Prunus speciosa]
MEEDASLLMCQLNSISDLVLTETMISFYASVSSSPLFSSIVTLYALILLYFPYHFIRIVFSPVPIITGILLLTILRLGAVQRFEVDEHGEKEDNSCLLETECTKTNQSKECNEENKENRGSTSTSTQRTEVQEQIPTSPEAQDHSFFTYQSDMDSESEMGFDPNPCFEDFFVEWNLKAPLEVIYEENEGEEDEMDRNGNDPNSKQEQESQVRGLERYPSLSMYYPESDSDSSSDGGYSVTGVWDSPETMCFRWEEEDREGLIEIALEENSKRGMDFQVDHEEENLIEIDISPTRNNEYCGEKWLFSGERFERHVEANMVVVEFSTFGPKCTFDKGVAEEEEEASKSCT